MGLVFELHQHVATSNIWGVGVGVKFVTFLLRQICCSIFQITLPKSFVWVINISLILLLYILSFSPLKVALNYNFNKKTEIQDGGSKMADNHTYLLEIMTSLAPLKYQNTCQSVYFICIYVVYYIKEMTLPILLIFYVSKWKNNKKH